MTPDGSGQEKWLVCPATARRPCKMHLRSEWPSPPKSVGNVPLRRLFSISKAVLRPVSFPNSEGTVPEMKLSFNWSVAVKPSIRPSSVGMPPVSEFQPMLSFARLTRRPSCVGIEL